MPAAVPAGAIYKLAAGIGAQSLVAITQTNAQRLAQKSTCALQGFVIEKITVGVLPPEGEARLCSEAELQTLSQVQDSAGNCLSFEENQA